MIKDTLRRIGITLVLLGMLCALGATAFAVTTPDLNETGSITVTLRDSETGETIPGGEVTLYRVAKVREDDGNYFFTFLDGLFADYTGTSLENVESADLAGDLTDYVMTHDGIPETTKSVAQDGTVTYEDLELGLYLVVQSKPAAGYAAASPFVVTLPVWNDETGNWDYQVDAYPKGGEAAPTESTEPSVPTTNEPKLPQTGQLNWPVPVLVVLGLVLFSAGWLLRFGKKKDGHEE